MRDGALHGRRRRDTVVDDDDIPPLDRYRWRVAANALLELARELLVEVTQAENFAPIYVKLGYAQPV